MGPTVKTVSFVYDFTSVSTLSNKKPDDDMLEHVRNKNINPRLLEKDNTPINRFTVRLFKGVTIALKPVSNRTT